MISKANITAAILAGGASTRMGTNKALITLGDRTLIELIASAAQAVLDHLIIIADQAHVYEFLQLPIFPDIYPQCGPLGGLHSALVHAPTSHVLVTSCDLPFITSEMISMLAEQAEEGTITLVSDGKRTHPLFGIYPRVLQHHVEHALQLGQRRMLDYVKGMNARVLDFSPFQSKLLNINTPQELTQAQRELKSHTR